jgi:hypothetical protein
VLPFHARIFEGTTHVFNLFRRRRQPQPLISPAEAREIVEKKLADPNLSREDRAALRHIEALCQPLVAPVLDQRRQDKA